MGEELRSERKEMCKSSVGRVIWWSGEKLCWLKKYRWCAEGRGNIVNIK